MWTLQHHIVVRFAFWYTRKTSAGLWIEAQWLWIACELSNFAVGLISPFVTKEPDPYPSFFGFVFALASIAYVPYMATTLLHLERPTRYSSAPWWKRNPLSFRRRRLTRREKKSIALAGTIDSKPFYVVFALCLVLESFAHQPFHPISGLEVVWEWSEPPKSFQTRRFNASIVRSASSTQTLARIRLTGRATATT